MVSTSHCSVKTNQDSVACISAHQAFSFMVNRQNNPTHAWWVDHTSKCWFLTTQLICLMQFMYQQRHDTDGVDSILRSCQQIPPGSINWCPHIQNLNLSWLLMWALEGLFALLTPPALFSAAILPKGSVTPSLNAHNRYTAFPLYSFPLQTLGVNSFDYNELCFCNPWRQPREYGFHYMLMVSCKLLISSCYHSPSFHIGRMR